MVSAQDKLMAVASRLGLDTLQYMQGSTGAIYDADTDNNGVIFGNASRHTYVNVTNLTDNRFEVNEALLIEAISFYTVVDGEGLFYGDLSQNLGQETLVVFDLVIGNKTVMKDTPVWSAGSPYSFASAGLQVKSQGANYIGAVIPRNQVYMEGAGIVIPPQVDFQINYKVYDATTGQLVVIPATAFIGAYLFGTKVNLNFNTTL
jgi:hypothetical protein